MESEVERHLGVKAKQLGFLYWKFSPTEMDGVPDRILIGHGKIMFIELKRPGKILRKKQVYRHKQIREHGGDVCTISSIKEADTLLGVLTGKG